jgi:hypothetical protein
MLRRAVGDLMRLRNIVILKIVLKIVSELGAIALQQPARSLISGAVAASEGVVARDHDLGSLDVAEHLGRH